VNHENQIHAHVVAMPGGVAVSVTHVPGGVPEEFKASNGIKIRSAYTGRVVLWDASGNPDGVNDYHLSLCNEGRRGIDVSPAIDDFNAAKDYARRLHAALVELNSKLAPGGTRWRPMSEHPPYARTVLAKRADGRWCNALWFSSDEWRFIGGNNGRAFEGDYTAWTDGIDEPANTVTLTIVEVPG